MFEKIGKHSVKIFVFFINILLAAIAVLVIREKDQARLLNNSKDTQSNVDTPSFKENLNLDSSGSDSADIPSESQSNPVDQNASSDALVPSEPVSSSSTAPAAPVPTVKQPAAPDRKTKTS